LNKLTLSALILSASVFACAGQSGTTSGAQAISQVSVSAEPSAVYAVDGSVTFSVKLPSSQQYVEVFSRNNGLQNIAQAIVGTGVVNSDGTTTYSYKAYGYKAGDVVEYRFYSYLPNSPGVFTPGPVENKWNTLVVQTAVMIPVAKDASLYRSSYYLGDLSNNNYGNATGLSVMSYLDYSDAILGFGLSSVTSGAVVTHARLLLNVHALKGGAGDINLSVVNDSTSWNELTVTSKTTPAATLAGAYTLPASGQASLDVTALVAAAVTAGKPELSFLLTPKGGVFSIDSKENPSGLSPALEVTLSSAPALSGWVDTKWYVPGQVLRSCFLNLGWTVPAGFEGSVDHYELFTTANGGATWDYWMNMGGNSLIYSWTPDEHATISVVAVSTTGVRSAHSNALSI